MTVTQTQRILDLALAGQQIDQIAHALNVTEAVVETALQDLTSTPSGQAGAGAYASISTTGNAAVGGDLAVAGKLGVNGAAAVGKSSAYTLTYSTQARTVPAATVAAVVTTASTNSTPYGFTQAQADAIPVAINALTADVLALKKVIVSLVADLQAVGIAA